MTKQNLSNSVARAGAWVVCLALAVLVSWGAVEAVSTYALWAPDDKYVNFGGAPGATADFDLSYDSAANALEVRASAQKPITADADTNAITAADWTLDMGAITSSGAVTADSVSVGGGYAGGSGVTLTTTGLGQFSSSITTDLQMNCAGNVNVSGGYGSAGLTIDETVGKILTDGGLTLGGDILSDDASLSIGVTGDTNLIGLSVDLLTVGGRVGSGLVSSTGGFVSTSIDVVNFPYSTDCAFLAWNPAAGSAILLAGKTPDFVDYSDIESLTIASDNLTLGVSGVTTGVTTHGTLYAIGDVNSTGDLTVDNEITIDAEAGEDCSMEFRDADVAHGVTDEASTDAFFRVDSATSLAGGAVVQGYSDLATTEALSLMGVIGGGGSTTVPAVSVNAAASSGTATAALSGTERLWELQNDGTETVSITGAPTVELTSPAGTGRPELALVDADCDHGMSDAAAMGSVARLARWRARSATDGGVRLTGAAAGTGVGLELGGATETGGTNEPMQFIVYQADGTDFGALDPGDPAFCWYNDTTEIACLNADGDWQFDGDMVQGSTTITETEIGYLDGLTAGTASASKAVVLDANKRHAGMIYESYIDRELSGDNVVGDGNEQNYTLSAALMKATIPANTLVAGDKTQLDMAVIVTDQNSSNTLTMRVYSTAGLMCTVSGNPDDDDIFVAHAEMYWPVVGASGVAYCVSEWVADARFTITDEVMAHRVSFDTTAAVEFWVTGEWSAASADNESQLDFIDLSWR